MKLTRNKAIKICIELWEWLAETGLWKDDWPGWEKYVYMSHRCPFCEYANMNIRGDYECNAKCPIQKHYRSDCCHRDLGFIKWVGATTTRTRKKYARIFLGKLREIK